MKQKVKDKKLSWGSIKEALINNDFELDESEETYENDPTYSEEQRQEDELRSAQIQKIIS